MKQISQKEIASFIGVSQQTICDIKMKRRVLGKKNAMRISKLTGIPFETLAVKNGETLLRKIRYAFVQRYGEAK
jgi:transcriptional regulator with XRE-family HTH domain